MKYLDVPATCRIVFYDNGNLDAVVVMLGEADPCNVIGQLGMGTMPGQECQVVGRAIREHEDKVVTVEDDFDLDDDAGDRAREAEAEEERRLYGAS